jgi:uncharacterized protein YqhQ
VAEKKKKFNYGGQAVIEGVMIRGRTAMVTAVRRPNGEIATEVKPLSSVTESKARRIPFVRGVVVLFEAMVLGIKSLLSSANVALEEEDEKISTKAIWGMMLVSVALVVVLFFIAPLFLTRWTNSFIPDSNSLIFNLIEGAIRMVIFLAYLKIISFMQDIKRVFTYHGAEHKAVNAYEAGVPMDVEHLKKFKRAHVRCGTSFMFFVMFIAIIVFTLVGVWDIWLMVLSRIVLIPVIMGLGYELIYFGARHTDNWFVKILLAPGLWLQSMTTGEPDDKQLEVAIAAMNKAVEVDQADEAAQRPAEA